MNKPVCLMLLFFNVLICQGQTNNWKNIYIASYDSVNYKFEIQPGKDYFVIKYYFNRNGKDTIAQYTITDMNDRMVFAVSVKKLLENTDKKGKVVPEDISSILYEKYKNRILSTEFENRNELLEKDRGSKIGILSLKSTSPATKNVYLILLKRTEKKFFKRNKKTDFTKKLRTKSNLSKRDELMIKYDSSCLKRRGFGQLKNFYRKGLDSLNIKTIKVFIDSVDIAFEEGIIKDMVVRAKLLKKLPGIKDSVFYFANAGYIPVRNSEDIDLLSCKGRNYLSFLYTPDSLMLLDFADALDCNRNIPYASGTYVPKDTTICIKPGNENRVELHKPTIAKTFDIRLFSDVSGYNGNVPNGIIQFEARLDFCLNEGKNKYSLFKLWKHNFNSHRQQFVRFNRISPYFKLTKIEKINNRLYIDANENSKDLLNFFKYSHFDAGTEFNLLTYRTNSKRFRLNMAGGIFRTTIGNDSIESNNIEASTLYMNPNLDFQFFESNKIDFNLKLGLYGGWTISHIDSFDLVKAKVAIKNYVKDKTHYWAQFQQSINIHPGGEKSNSIFIRTSQFVSLKNSYFTFQIGYSTSLGNFLNIK